jgi:hypothetical protein
LWLVTVPSISLSLSALAATQKLELRFRTPTRLAPTLNP